MASNGNVISWVKIVTGRCDKKVTRSEQEEEEQEEEEGVVERALALPYELKIKGVFN